MTITPRRQRTQDKLIDAGIRVFARKGVAGAPIEELCDEAGLTRGAFYSNFESKDELVLAIIDSAIAHAISGLRSHIEDTIAADGTANSDGADLAERARQCAVEAREMSPEERRREVAQKARTVFEDKQHERLPWANSAEWVVCEQEIELYTVRVPELRSRYRMLLDAQLRSLSELIETTLAEYGCAPTIPTLDLVRILSAITRQSSMDALHGGIEQGDVAADPQPIIQVLMAFIDFG